MRAVPGEKAQWKGHCIWVQILPLHSMSLLLVILGNSVTFLGLIGLIYHINVIIIRKKHGSLLTHWPPRYVLCGAEQ